LLSGNKQESDNGVVEFEAFLKNCLPTEKLSNLTLLELHFNITPKQRAAMGKAVSEEIKASFNLGSSASSSAVRGGRRKQSVGGDDDDFEDEEDGRESLDEDEYVPTARGRGGRGGRGKANGRGGQRGKATHQRDEELESDDPAVGGMDYHQFDMAFAAADGLASIERKVPVVTYTHSKAITRALCRLIWYPMNEEVGLTTSLLGYTSARPIVLANIPSWLAVCRTRCRPTSCWRSSVNILLRSCNCPSLSMIDTTWLPC
jgi:hypothetical protein